MFFELDEDQRTLQSAVRAFLEKNCPAHSLLRRIENRSTDVALYRKLCAELGILGAAVPSDRGGSGGGLAELFVIFMELGRVLYGGPYLPSVLAAEVIANLDLQGNCASELTDLIEGKSQGAVAGLNGDQDAKLNAVESDGKWKISGLSSFVFSGDANILLVFVETEQGTDCFLIEDHQSVTREPINLLDLSRSAANLHFHSASARRVGPAGGAASARARLLEMAALCVAAEQIGVAERALELAVEHAKLRKQFGSPIGAFQAVKHRCADAAVALEAASCTGLHAAWAIDRGIETDQPFASLAKSVCVEASVQVTASAIQVLGGIGYTWEHPIHLYYRRAIASRQSFGSTRSHRENVASRLFAHG